MAIFWWRSTPMLGKASSTDTPQRLSSRQKLNVCKQEMRLHGDSNWLFTVFFSIWSTSSPSGPLRNLCLFQLAQLHKDQHSPRSLPYSSCWHQRPHCHSGRQHLSQDPGMDWEEPRHCHGLCCLYRGRRCHGLFDLWSYHVSPCEICLFSLMMKPPGRHNWRCLIFHRT